MDSTNTRQRRTGSARGRSFSSSKPKTADSARSGGNFRGARSGGSSAGARSGGSSFRGARSSGPSRGGRSFGGGDRNRGGRGGGRAMPTFDPTQFINKNPVKVEQVAYVATHKFSDFDIDKRLVDTIASMGITSPSPIQDQIIPHILEGKDVVGLAETGTGKTAAFLVPLIELTKKHHGTQTLILTPTRELALQVEAELRKLAKNFNFFSTVCVGGTNIRPQIRGVRRKNHFIIGTPGRVMDLIDRGDLQTDKFTTVVLDEADRMLDMGFIHDMRKILEDIREDRHTLFFSATMDEKTKGLVKDFMKDPVMVSVKKRDVTDSIVQDVVPFTHDKKFEKLVELLKKDEFARVLVFGSMKHSVEKLGKELNQNGISADSIHGNKSHPQRQRSLAKFKNGQIKVLVATDVAARGIHVDNVSHVINYDLPNTFEDYVHRIGRTGRGDKFGKALTFVQDKPQHRR